MFYVIKVHIVHRNEIMNVIMKRLPFAVYLMAIVSCYNGMPDHLESDAINQVEVDEVIPVDVALQTLEEFMNDNDLIWCDQKYR